MLSVFLHALQVLFEGVSDKFTNPFNRTKIFQTSFRFPPKKGKAQTSIKQIKNVKTRKTLKNSSFINRLFSLSISVSISWQLEGVFTAEKKKLYSSIESRARRHNNRNKRTESQRWHVEMESIWKFME